MSSSMQLAPASDKGADVHPYATLAYAETLAHLGRPFYVKAWGSYILKREWTNGVFDAIGPYPLTCLRPDSDLPSGLEELRREGMVTVTLVVDSLLGPSLERLAGTFNFVRPFKTHYLVNMRTGSYAPSKHHNYEIRRATSRGVEVRIVSLDEIMREWTKLYTDLIARHRIVGSSSFSLESFERLARCEGLVVFAGYLGKELVSCHLWIEFSGCVWSHLGASSSAGYDSGAAYAVYDRSIRHFSGAVMDLGGSAGIRDSATDGLARFKSGFSNVTKTVALAGSILDSETYRVLCRGREGTGSNEYFPAYRAPSVAT